MIVQEEWENIRIHHHPIMVPGDHNIYLILMFAYLYVLVSSFSLFLSETLSSVWLGLRRHWGIFLF